MVEAQRYLEERWIARRDIEKGLGKKNDVVRFTTTEGYTVGLVCKVPIKSHRGPDELLVDTGNQYQQLPLTMVSNSKFSYSEVPNEILYRVRELLLDSRHTTPAPAVERPPFGGYSAHRTYAPGSNLRRDAPAFMDVFPVRTPAHPQCASQREERSAQLETDQLGGTKLKTGKTFTWNVGTTMYKIMSQPLSNECIVYENGNRGQSFRTAELTRASDDWLHLFVPNSDYSIPLADCLSSAKAVAHTLEQLADVTGSAGVMVEKLDAHQRSLSGVEAAEAVREVQWSVADSHYSVRMLANGVVWVSDSSGNKSRVCSCHVSWQTPTPMDTRLQSCVDLPSRVMLPKERQDYTPYTSESRKVLNGLRSLLEAAQIRHNISEFFAKPPPLVRGYATATPLHQSGNVRSNPASPMTSTPLTGTPAGSVGTSTPRQHIPRLNSNDAPIRRETSRRSGQGTPRGLGGTFAAATRENSALGGSYAAQKSDAPLPGAKAGPAYSRGHGTVYVDPKDDEPRESTSSSSARSKPASSEGGGSLVSAPQADPSSGTRFQQKQAVRSKAVPKLQSTAPAQLLSEVVSPRYTDAMSPRTPVATGSLATPRGGQSAQAADGAKGIPVARRASQGGPSSPAPKKVTERTTLESNLRRFGFIEHPVAADGNCQFRSIAWHALRDVDKHKEVRKQVVAHLKKHEDLYAAFVVDCTFKEFVSRMGATDTWGDHITLQAAADRYGLLLNVITSHVYEDDDANGKTKGGWMHKIRPRDSSGNAVEPKAEYWLSYCEEALAEHYNPVTRRPKR